MDVAKSLYMPKALYGPLEFIPPLIDKKLDDLIVKATSPEDPKRRRKKNQKAARKRAKALGIKPVSGVENKIRSILNERIIQEVKHRKLTHADVRSISLVSRTRITAIMNRNLHEASIDLLIKILSSLGISSNIYFD